MQRYVVANVVTYSAILGAALLMWWGLFALLQGFVL